VEYSPEKHQYCVDGYGAPEGPSRHGPDSRRAPACDIDKSEIIYDPRPSYVRYRAIQPRFEIKVKWIGYNAIQNICNIKHAQLESAYNQNKSNPHTRRNKTILPACRRLAVTPV